LGDDVESRGQFHRLGTLDRGSIRCSVDGRPVEALEGDTVLTLLMLQGRTLRRFEFGPERRAGFCLIGACQDCWVRGADDAPVRACTTLVERDMEIRTGAGDDA
jgi:predicted molibdopterin-dependent oxidoreductase YjgC